MELLIYMLTVAVNVFLTINDISVTAVEIS